MVHVYHRIHVPASARATFGVLADVELHPRWQASAQRSRWTSAPPHRQGATFHETHRVFGMTLEHVFAVTAYEQDRLLAYECRDGLHPVHITHRVEPAINGAVVEFELRTHLNGFLRLSAPMARRLVRRMAKADFARFSRLLAERVQQAA